MKTLYLIPARGGSKGLPGKNIKELNSRCLSMFGEFYDTLLKNLKRIEY